MAVAPPTHARAQIVGCEEVLPLVARELHALMLSDEIFSVGDDFPRAITGLNAGGCKPNSIMSIGII